MVAVDSSRPEAVLTQIKQCVNKRGEVITDQGLKCVGDSFRQLFDRDPYWQQLQGLHGLTSYSLRHGYAWRAHKCGDRQMAVRDAAALMGHDPSTHQKHYGRWVDEQGLDDAVARWRGQQLPRKKRLHKVFTYIWSQEPSASDMESWQQITRH